MMELLAIIKSATHLLCLIMAIFWCCVTIWREAKGRDWYFAGWLSAILVLSYISGKIQ